MSRINKSKILLGSKTNLNVTGVEKCYNSYMSNVSVKNSIATLDYLTSTPENQYLERKGIEEGGPKPTKLANEIIGMLNADGGIVVLGISDNGAVQDLKTLGEDKLRDFRKVLYDFVEPPANAHLEELTTDNGELIFLYHIEQDFERLFQRKDNKEVYRRVADSNKGPLSTEEIDKLRYDKSIQSYEDQVRKDFDPNDLDKRSLDDYKSKINFSGTHDDLLVNRNLAIKNQTGKLQYRNSAVLLFAIDPEKYNPSAYVRYIRYEGNQAKSGSEFNVVKDEKFYGNIPTLIRKVQGFLYASLDDFYYLDTTLGAFVTVSEYPQDAWLEGIVNALFHRSYNLQGNSIYIKQFDDRLEISNSGPLPAQVTVRNIRQNRFSRNPRIGRVLSEMGYVRELNEGVNRIYNSMEKSMLSQPLYIDKNDIVTLVLTNKVSKNEKSLSTQALDQIQKDWSNFNETERKIIDYLFNNFKATVDQFAEAAGVTPQAVRPYVNNFVDKGLFVRNSVKIRDKNALYTLKKV